MGFLIRFCSLVAPTRFPILIAEGLLRGIPKGGSMAANLRFCLACGLGFLAWLPCGLAAPPTELFDGRNQDALARVVATDARVVLAEGRGLSARLPPGKSGRLVVKLSDAPSVDLAGFTRLEVVVKGLGPGPALVNILALDAKGNSVAASRGIAGGATVTNRIVFRRRPPASVAATLQGLKNNFPGGFATGELPWTFVDPGNMAAMAIQAVSEEGAAVELISIRAAGEYREPPWTRGLDTGTFFPFVDRYGQFRHASWPEKILSEDDLIRRSKAEDESLGASPRPTNWNRFGGWLGGTRAPGSGAFRVGRVDGRFSLLDPDGCPFFSIGLTTITPKFASSPVTDREHFFDLPAGGEPGGEFMLKNSFKAWAGFYANRDYRQYSFSEANLHRKYGSDYIAANAERIHRRLSAWGINSIGAWGDEAVSRMGKTAYFVMLAPELPKVPAVAKLVDIHHPDFEAQFASYAHRLQWIRQDPWCVGVFFNNEVHWGERGEITAKAILKSPGNQPWRRHLEEVMAREGLSGNWEALGDMIYREYYETVFRLVKKYFPEKLFVGQREAWGWADNARSRRFSFQNCDVFSANIYQDDVSWLSPPPGVEKPILIGEFHFGASDTGLGAAMGTETQADRARAYGAYMASALGNPWVVGAHWFQYGDQPVSGRFDGECINTGFVTVGDIPYEALVIASREVGDAMYVTRSKAPRLPTTRREPNP